MKLFLFILSWVMLGFVLLAILTAERGQSIKHEFCLFFVLSIAYILYWFLS